MEGATATGAGEGQDWHTDFVEGEKGWARSCGTGCSWAGRDCRATAASTDAEEPRDRVPGRTFSQQRHCH